MQWRLQYIFYPKYPNYIYIYGTEKFVWKSFEFQWNES